MSETVFLTLERNICRIYYSSGFIRRRCSSCQV